jgi:hypothetical protein
MRLTLTQNRLVKSLLEGYTLTVLKTSFAGVTTLSKPKIMNHRQSVDVAVQTVESLLKKDLFMEQNGVYHLTSKAQYLLEGELL